MRLALALAPFFIMAPVLSPPVTFFNKQIVSCHSMLATYEQELISLVIAMRHSCRYLSGRTFLIGTNHFSLKFLLDQRLSTIPQHQWLSKLPGTSNIVVDALSHRDMEDSGEVLALIAPTFQLYKDLQAELAGDLALHRLYDEVRTGTCGDEWKLTDDTVVGRIYVPPSSSCLPVVLAAAHGVTHEGVERTLHRLRHIFFLPSMRAIICDHIHAFVACQQKMVDQLRPGGLLQPLNVPSVVWADNVMDFVEGFPRINGKSVILRVVNQFSKFSHFIPLGHSYMATSVACAFFTNIVRLHGLPSSIVSNHDPVFTGIFW
jgi:hypothetical protein